ncbi:hypothetical protein [Streptomyces sp. URMC 125]|uniref:hypothetical protein n=1 Tax=Streptomyces sp. URMC 125 TaxID=3423419 RepID=UPI003F1AF598
MPHDTLAAESCRDDSHDGVRPAALARVHWPVDLLEPQRMAYWRDASTWRAEEEYERFEAVHAATRAGIRERPAACADEAVVLLVHVTEHDRGSWFAESLRPALGAAERLRAEGRRATASRLRYAHAEIVRAGVDGRRRELSAKRLRALLAGVDEAHIPDGLTHPHAPWAAPLRDRVDTSPTLAPAGFIWHLASLPGPRPAQRRRTCLELTDAASARNLVAETLQAPAEDDPLYDIGSGSHAAWSHGDSHHHHVVRQDDKVLARSIVWAGVLAGGLAAPQTLWRLHQITHRALHRQLDTALAAREQGSSSSAACPTTAWPRAARWNVNRVDTGVQVAIEDATDGAARLRRPRGRTSPRTAPAAVKDGFVEPDETILHQIK